MLFYFAFRFMGKFYSGGPCLPFPMENLIQFVGIKADGCHLVT